MRKCKESPVSAAFFPWTSAHSSRHPRFPRRANVTRRLAQTRCFYGRIIATKDGKRHTCWSLVETIRTPDGPRQRTLCHLGELNDSAQARWLKTIEVFNEGGERHELKLFSWDVAPPPEDAEVAQRTPTSRGRASPRFSRSIGSARPGASWRLKSGGTRRQRSTTCCIFPTARTYFAALDSGFQSETASTKS